MYTKYYCLYVVYFVLIIVFIIVITVTSTNINHDTNKQLAKNDVLTFTQQMNTIQQSNNLYEEQINDLLEENVKLKTLLKVS